MPVFAAGFADVPSPSGGAEEHQLQLAVPAVRPAASSSLPLDQEEYQLQLRVSAARPAGDSPLPLGLEEIQLQLAEIEGAEMRDRAARINHVAHQLEQLHEFTLEGADCLRSFLEQHP